MIIITSKYKFIIVVFIIYILTSLTGCFNSKEDLNRGDEDKEDIGNVIIPKEPIDEVEIDMIEEKIKTMSLDEKIGQLLIVGFEGSEINEQVKTEIIENKVGGVILFSRNIDNQDQTLQLINDIKLSNSSNKIPLFISVDEEGGTVARLDKIYDKLPDAKKLGDMNNSEISYEYGRLLGEKLNNLGFNLNYAPVLDINSNPKNPVIGVRALGDNPELVTKNGIELINGIRSKKVIPSVKHFPGHGDTDIDSHINLPITNKSLEELKRFELLPFINAIDEDIEMIMVAHILFKQLDDEFPSSMSKVIITDLLRKDLGYKGVVITDDLTMGAIVKNYSLDRAAIEYFKAGGDIALICHGEDNPKLVIDELKASISNGQITLEEIDEKVYRILTLKEKYKLNNEIKDKFDIEKTNESIKNLLKLID